MYTLPGGRSIELTFEQWFNLTDEDIEFMVAFGTGEFVENPFRGSSLEKPDSEIDEEIYEDIVELTDISIEERFLNIEEDE